MKKLLYIYSLFICQLLIGQNYPTIYPLSGGFTFNDQRLEKYDRAFQANSTSCDFVPSDRFKYFSFEANFDMNFSFELIANNPNFRFLLWKLEKDKLATAIFDRGGTITPLRSVYNSKLIKGLRSGENDECEGYNSENNNGFVKALEGNNRLEKGEKVVIGIYGEDIDTPFDIKVNVAREETIDSFNNLCRGETYTYNQIIEEVENSSGYTDITLYKNNTFSDSDKINPGETFNSDTTLFAQVKDDSGSLQVIYTIPLSFIPDHQFIFKSNIQSYYLCTNEFIIPSNQEILSRLFDNVLSSYSISSISINGINYNSGDRAPITQSTEIKIKVFYNGECPIPSDEKSISLISNIPALENIYENPICGDEYIVDFDDIFSLISKDKNQFDLIVKYNGNQIANGTSLPITDQLNLKISIKSKSGGRCESNEVDFVINKTEKADIKDDAKIEGYCINDYNFTPTLVGAAVNRIQNGNSYTLKYYKEDGSIISMDRIYDYMKEILVGKVIVKALAADNLGICDTEVELKFNNFQGFIGINTIIPFNKDCYLANTTFTFTKNDIENYLRDQYNNQNLVFEDIVDTTVLPNSSQRITYKVKEPNGCLSDTYTLELKLNNIPDFSDKEDSVKYCEGNTIIFNSSYFIRNFGDSITEYQVKIDGVILDWNSTISKTLNFGTSTFISIDVEILNASNCNKNLKLIINKKKDNPILPPTQEALFKNTITFCSGDDDAAIKQLNAAINAIRNIQYQHIKLTEEISREILEEYRKGNKIVSVDFRHSDYCQPKKAEFIFDEKEKPSIVLPPIAEVCNFGVSILDLKDIIDYENYDFELYDNQNNLIPLLDTFYNLTIGNYTLEVSYKGSSCTTPYPVEVKAAPTPIIEKIIINKGEIIVQAKGEKTLEYALYDYFGNNIVPWQKNKILKIPNGVSLQNASVQVKMDNCRITSRDGIYILDIEDVYTPNGDSFNNKWATGLGDNINEYQIQIFDRYGVIVYQNQGVGVLKWDGKKNGKPVPTDTYYYLIQPFNSTNDLQVQYSGSILVKHK